MIEAARLRFHEAQVAEVVLANPGRLNAMDPVFFAELAAIFAGIAESRMVRAWSCARKDAPSASGSIRSCR